jgi:hypothetical protein
VIVAGHSRAVRLLLYVVIKGIVLTSLIASIFVLSAPSFLGLLLPVFLVLFAWHGLYSHWLYGLTRTPWVAAVMNAVTFAWLIAATFPLVSAG